MKRLIPLLVLASLACQLSQLASTQVPAGDPTHPSSSVVFSTATLATVAVGIAPTATVSPTPAPYEQYTIDYLRARTYGGGEIEIVETMEETDWFTRYLIRYPSDGLNIYGFANVPKGDGPFPVIVAVHGFVKPGLYQTLDYTAPALDRIAQDGYIVFHPDLRGYGSSGNGDNLFRVGMTIDVLNLMALIQSEAGPAELFAAAMPEKLGLWGHSMGGSIVLRALTVSSDVKATVLIAPMSGEELRNSQLLLNIFPDANFQTEVGIAPEVIEHISPVNYYRDITSPIQLHHGTADQTVPVAWSEETCRIAADAGVQIECIYYPGEDHTFRSRVADQFYGAMINFYTTYLSP